ncbi:hypothetical protein ACUSIJ_26700 [Pseudochelatococcus sp. B33]
MPFQWPGKRGRLRAIEIGSTDKQLCDGVHVRRTDEVGAVKITGLFPVGRGRLRAAVALPEIQALDPAEVRRRYTQPRA